MILKKAWTTLFVLLGCGLILNGCATANTTIKPVHHVSKAKKLDSLSPNWSDAATKKFTDYFRAYATKQGAQLRVATVKHPQRYYGYTWPHIYAHSKADYLGRNMVMRSGTAKAHNDNYTVLATYALQGTGQPEPYAVYTLTLRYGVPGLSEVEVEPASGHEPVHITARGSGPKQLTAARIKLADGKKPASPVLEPLASAFDAAIMLKHKFGTADNQGEFSWRAAGDDEDAQFASGDSRYYVITKTYSVISRNSASQGSTGYGMETANDTDYYVNVKTQRVVAATSKAGKLIAANLVQVKLDSE